MLSWPESAERRRSSSCFCAVLGTEAGLKRFKEGGGDEVGCELSGNGTFQYFC